MELHITKEKVVEAANKCSQAREVLKTLFPEAFSGPLPLAGQAWADKSNLDNVYIRISDDSVAGWLLDPWLKDFFYSVNRQGVIAKHRRDYPGVIVIMSTQYRVNN